MAQGAGYFLMRAVHLYSFAPPKSTMAGLFLEAYEPPRCAACPHLEYKTPYFPWAQREAGPRILRPPKRWCAILRAWVLYRGTSLIRRRSNLGPCSRTMPRALWRS